MIFGIEAKVLLLTIFVLRLFYARCTMRIVLLVEKDQQNIPTIFADTLQNFETKNPESKVSDELIFLDRENEEDSRNNLCAILSKGVTIIFDLTWSEWDFVKNISMNRNIPRVKFQTGAIIIVLDALLDLLEARNATNAVLVFETETDLDQALHNLIGETVLKLLVIEGMNDEQALRLKNMRPIPENIVLIGGSIFVQEAYKIAKKNGLLTLADRWILTFTDLNYMAFDTSILEPLTIVLSIENSIGCRLQNSEDSCIVDKDFQIQYVFLNKVVDYILGILSESLSGNQLTEPVKILCELGNTNSVEKGNPYTEKFMKMIKKSINMNNSMFTWNERRNEIRLRGTYSAQVANNTNLEIVAKWSTGEKFKTIQGNDLKPIRLFYRIGIAMAVPWTYVKIDPLTGDPLKTSDGNYIYEGYCIDLIEKLSQVMDFDYDLVVPQVGNFGKKLSNGSWTGIIGDLVMGNTDLAVAATIMTSQREEVVDFVAPYFEQTGISIVIRKPMRKTSLFKFMTVLRVEVWLSIVAALTFTAILLSVLDKYSPYSARNNKKDYPYPCRKFTLKESFWFALTSFTPQGGGETPKALSGRTLVAAYWLFVVLMLATFTANLAAFLTVERMQTPVASLEQLARQSRINYTVVEGQMAHTYFINMKHAEDTLYRVWKEITLNSTSDETVYQVWDYPIKEQYGHILLAINSSNPVASAKEGFEKVNENIDADFALIHDSSEIKYEVSRNCNLTEVGEIFGERPYSIAVQQGSRFQDDISKVILELQKDRFFEKLTAKYWNNSLKGTCDDSDESEGITLESLGGVFIATLFGLALAMVMLVWEVLYYKRKKAVINNKEQINVPPKLHMITKKLAKRRKFGLTKNSVTIGETFKPVAEKNKFKVSWINVDPNLAWNP